MEAHDLFMSFLFCQLLNYYLAFVAQFTQSEAKGTFVLQQFYSAIVIVACPERRIL